MTDGIPAMHNAGSISPRTRPSATKNPKAEAE
jgi:hypothetical protein